MRTLGHRPQHVTLALLAAAGMNALAASCNSDTPTVSPDMSAAASGEAGTSSSSDNPNGDGSGGSLNLGGSLGNAAGASSAEGDEPGSVGKDDACATSSESTSALPAVLELVVDTSGSMDWPPGWAPKDPNDSKPPGATKWEITRDALADAAAALSADTALGVSFYPNIEQEGDVCLMTSQTLPIALLGGNKSSQRAELSNALSDVVPVGATPTHGGYRFGLQQLTASTLPGNKFLLLITDGTPTCTLDCTCTENNEPVDSQPLLAEATAALKDGVRTFVIGSPGSEETRALLSQLASQGGTARKPCSDSGPNYCHFDMTTQKSLASALAAALAEITMSIKSCEYPIPAPPAGQTLDPDRVNVLYTREGGGSETIPRDASLHDCTEGWQYSSDAQSIYLCGDACARAQSEIGTVEILFGCQTIVEKPR
ncbi:MAG TPA: vWA domain-containing protein [Polyangiaceae bacterium]|nr:vWA domain-containing protein [Polyangiaceae bacterium]